MAFIYLLTFALAVSTIPSVTTSTTAHEIVTPRNALRILIAYASSSFARVHWHSEKNGRIAYKVFLFSNCQQSLKKNRWESGG